MKDLCIEKVVNVYFRRQSNWKRDVFKTRGFDCIVLFTQGSIEYNFAHKTVIGQAGDLVLLPGNLPYSGKKHTEQVAYFVIDLVCSREDEFARFMAPEVIGRQEQLFDDFSSAVEQWQRQAIDVQLQLKSFAYSLLCKAFEADESKPNTQTQVLLDHIATNIADPKLSVAGLCKRFYISESQLRRNIQRVTGLTPNAYILTLRMNRAKNELLHTDRSIKAISQACGFSSAYYFSRCFSQATGLSPTAYRRAGE